VIAFPDTHEDRLLRAVEPPPVSGGFADRVMAALPAIEPTRSAPRDRRGPWLRKRKIVIASVAAGLLSVGAAAAAGLLGGRMQRLPVIATIAEAVNPRPVVAPKIIAKRPTTVTPPAKKDASVSVLTELDARREMAAQRIADRIARREAWRAARGLPPVDPGIRRVAQARLEQLPPGERRALVERVQAIRNERAASGADETPLPETRVERRQRWRERLKPLSPEERERLREWRERRRAIRVERAMRLTEPIE